MMKLYRELVLKEQPSPGLVQINLEQINLEQIGLEQISLSPEASGD